MIFTACKGSEKYWNRIVFRENNLLLILKKAWFDMLIWQFQEFCVSLWL